MGFVKGIGNDGSVGRRDEGNGEREPDHHKEKRERERRGQKNMRRKTRRKGRVIGEEARRGER